MNPWVMPSILAASLVVSGFFHFLAARTLRPLSRSNNEVKEAPINKVKETPKETPKDIPKETPPEQATSTQISDGRTIDSDDFQYLRSCFEGRTEIEAERLVQPYLGKWVRVSGTVANVVGGGDRASFTVTLENKYAFFNFREDRWRSRLEVLRQGAHISLLGRITSIHSWKIDIDDCELLNLALVK